MSDKPVVADGSFLRWQVSPWRVLRADAVREVRPPPPEEADEEYCELHTEVGVLCPPMLLEAFVEEWQKALAWTPADDQKELAWRGIAARVGLPLEGD